MTMFLTSRGFPSCVHGFTTRHGGVSHGRYASLNLGGRWGDDEANVVENLRRLGDAAGFAPAKLQRVRQVHGAIVIAAPGTTPETEADGLWLHRDHGAEAVIGVMTADCVPLLLVDERANAIAAVHSGWRGTVAGIARVAVETLAEAGIARESLRAAIGPCIEAAAFEVGEEVAAQFDEQFVLREPGRKPHVDLVAAVRDQLRNAGLGEDSIERVGGCTYAGERDFFSYRRDGAGIGQQLSFIGLAPATGR